MESVTDSLVVPFLCCEFGLVVFSPSLKARAKLSMETKMITVTFSCQMTLCSHIVQHCESGNVKPVMKRKRLRCRKIK